jgi:hypothetical protein
VAVVCVCVASNSVCVCVRVIDPTTLKGGGGDTLTASRPMTEVESSLRVARGEGFIVEHTHRHERC